MNSSDKTIQKPPPLTETARAHKESPLEQFSDKIGKVQIIEKQSNGSSGHTAGFYCATCRASFTSSDAYLDHCNGRVHQRNLGRSLKVEKIDDAERIKAKLKSLSQKRHIAEKMAQAGTNEPFERKLAEAEEARKRIKEDRKIRKSEKRKANNTTDKDGSNNEDQEDYLMNAMGFKSFS